MFVAGDDGAMWYLQFDGTVWKPWVSLGPAHRATADLAAVTFISEPTAAAFFPAADVAAVAGGAATSVASGGGGGTGSWPPPAPALVSSRTRVDVFAVGSDNALWHKWLDSKGWHGENIGYETGNWDLRGGSFACAPSLVAPNRGATVVAMPPATFSMLAPYTDGAVHRWSFDGTVWTEASDADPPHSFRPRFRLPSYF